MSTATILQLKQAIGLTGSEPLEAVQAGTSVRTTAAQIAALAPSITPTGPTGVLTAVPAPGQNNNYSAGGGAGGQYLDLPGGQAAILPGGQGILLPGGGPGSFGPAIGFLDLTPTAVCNITGLMAGADGQLVIITNLSTFPMTLNALNNNSLTPNQFRMMADLVLTQNNSQAFKYSATLGKWVFV